MRTNLCNTLLALIMLVACAIPTLAANLQVKIPSKSATVKDPITGVEFVFIKGGCFKMGSANGDSDEKQVHEVCVSDYYLGKCEVTQGQYSTVTGSNPSNFKQCGADCPVESVSWNDAQEFIKTLNAKSGKNYRLPTEAEWEYAARSGGKDEAWAGTNSAADLEKYAWYDKNSDQMTHRAGLKKSNGLGLHDMTGNVWEWCQDWYNEAYYKESPKDNPPGAAIGETRVLRGGAWSDDARNTRATDRDSSSPGHGNDNNGFRLALTLR